MSAAAGKKKKTKEEEEWEDEEDEMESGSEVSEQEIMADFEAFPPTDGDMGGIRALIQQTLPSSSLDFTGLSDLIIDQTPLGCIIKTAAEEGEDDVYGVFTVLDLNQNKECVKKVRKFINKKASKSEAVKASLSGGIKVGWLISERMVNLPFHIAPPALDSLVKDMKSGGAKYKFDKYVMVMKMLLPKAGATKGKAKATGGGGDEEEERIFVHPEEELLSEVCSTQLDWEVSGGAEGPEEESFRTFRRLVVFQHSALLKFIENVKAEIGS